MRALSAAELLLIWERGAGQAQIQRALDLLAATDPRSGAAGMATLSIGERDARLLALREQIFGPRLVSLVACPACAERVELSFDVGDILAAPGAPAPAPIALGLDGYELRFRLPNSLDVLAIAAAPDQAAAQRALLARCLLEAHEGGAERGASQLPDQVVAAIAEEMARADPQADVQLALDCPACDHGWLAVFDIVTFLLSELDAWAARTIREVHILARSYGWREADILAMSARRRQLYLELLSQ